MNNTTSKSIEHETIMSEKVYPPLSMEAILYSWFSGQHAPYPGQDRHTWPAPRNPGTSRRRAWKRARRGGGR